MNLLRKIIGKNSSIRKNFLALDIGTEFVKALIFYFDQEINKAVIIGAGKARQGIGNMTSGAVSDIEGTISICRRAISQAENMAEVSSPSEAIMGIAGEFVKGTTTTVHYERTQPEIRIDPIELKNIVHKVQWKAFDRIKRQMAWETGNSEIDVKLINAAVVDVKIDGYKVTNPINFQGREVTLSIFNAYAPMVHLGALHLISEELDLKLSSIAAEPYAVVRSMDVENDSDFSAIFIDIGGGTTDVAVVKNGSLEGTVMYALGGRSFTRRISNDLGLTMEDAERLKVRYGHGDLSPQVAQRLEKVLENDCQVWLSGLEVALESFVDGKIDLLPSRILLCGGGAGLPGIVNSIEKAYWYEEKRLPFAKKPTIGFIQPRDVVNVVDQTGFLRTPQDVTPMALANLMFNSPKEEKILSEALKKAVKMNN